MLVEILKTVLSALRSIFQSRAALLAENVVLRQQLIVLRRSVAKPHLRARDRVLLALVTRVFAKVLKAEPVEELALEVDYLERGRLAHELMAVFHRRVNQLRGGPASWATIRDRFDFCLGELKGIDVCPMRREPGAISTDFPA